MTDGRRLSRRVQQAKGQPDNPLTDDELRGKFWDCATRALPADRVELLLASVQALANAPDVGAVCRQLGSGRGMVA